MRVLQFVSLVLLYTVSFGDDVTYRKRTVNLNSDVRESHSFEKCFKEAVTKINEGDYNGALFQIKEARCWAELYRDTLQIVRSMRILAIVKRATIRDKSFPIYEKATLLAESHGYLDELIKLKIGYAIARTFHSEYGKALRIYLQAVGIAQTKGVGIQEVSVIYNNMGFIYYKLSNLEKALFYFRKSLEEKIRTQDIFDIERLHINVALCYVNMADYSNAIKHIEQALSFCGRYCFDQIVLESQFALGMISFELAKYDQAKINFESSLKISRERKEYRFIAENLHFLTRISFITNEHNQAHEYLLEGHQLAISCNLKEVLLENYSLWLVLLSKKNDVKHLTAFYQKYNVLREELHGIDMLTKIAAFEVDLEDQSNGETIEHQHQIMQFNEHLLNLHRTVYLAMIFIALLTVIVVFLLYKLILRDQDIGCMLAVRISERKETLSKNVCKLQMDHGVIRQRSISLMHLCGLLFYNPGVKSEQKVGSANYRLTSLINSSLLELYQLSNKMIKRFDVHE